MDSLPFQNMENLEMVIGHEPFVDRLQKIGEVVEHCYLLGLLIGSKLRTAT